MARSACFFDLRVVGRHQQQVRVVGEVHDGFFRDGWDVIVLPRLVERRQVGLVTLVQVLALGTLLLQ